MYRETQIIDILFQTYVCIHIGTGDQAVSTDNLVIVIVIELLSAGYFNLYAQIYFGKERFCNFRCR